MFKVNHDLQPKTIQEFINKWKSQEFPSKEILYDYKPFCKNLLFNSEEIVLETIDLLKKNICLFANQNSAVYKSQSNYTSKENLNKKELWYVENLKKESKQMSTSGSTTGKPFSYLSWKPFFEFIEGENHYDMILDEFQIKKNINVLCFFKNRFDKHNKYIFATKKTDNFLHRHGLSRNSTVHHVNFELYEYNKDGFFAYLFKYIQRNPIDVFFAAGPEINSLCHFIRKYNFKGKVANLLSNSNEMLLQTDVDFLFDGKYVNDICDHMRCWDGGATFFTCKYKNYHLCDNLSWSEEVDGKLVTTDYFSLPSPFVKYWNGDLCKIDDTYQRCECGRLYRDFTFVESRPFSLKGLSIEKYREQIKHSGIPNIKQVKCSVNHIEIVSSDHLSLDEKTKIKNILDKFDVKFSVEKEVNLKEDENKLSFIKFNIDCGSVVAECVVDKNDLSGESYIWQVLSECSGSSNIDDCSCQVSSFVNGTPCVFLGSKTEIPCDCVKITNNKNISDNEKNILFSLNKDCTCPNPDIPSDAYVGCPSCWACSYHQATTNCEGSDPACSGSCDFEWLPIGDCTSTPDGWSKISDNCALSLTIKPMSKKHSNIIFSLAKCTGQCNYFCFEANTPVLQSSNCSSGCGCPTLDPIQSQCFVGTAFSYGCV